MNKFATFQAKLDKFLNWISFLHQIMLNVLVSVAKINQFTIEDKIFART